MVMDKLKKIILLLEDSGQARLAGHMKKNMGKDRDKFCIYKIEKTVKGSQNINIETIITEAENTEYGNGSILYVTDSKQAIKALRDTGGYTAALLHENNKEEDLFGVPYAITDIDGQSFLSFERAFLRLSGQPFTIMETERCIIRETSVKDVDCFYKIYEDPSITCYMDNLYEDVEEEREYIREYIEKIYGFYGYGLWSVVDKKSGEVMGRALQLLISAKVMPVRYAVRLSHTAEKNWSLKKYRLLSGGRIKLLCACAQSWASHRWIQWIIME